MPSIKDLFLPDTADDPDFDLDDFLREADAAAGASPDRQYANLGITQDPEAAAPSAAPEVPAATSGDGAGEGDGELGTGGAPPATPVPPVVEPPTAPTDPFAALPEDRRRSLLALDEVMSSTPGAVDKVFEALKPVPRPEPRIPEGVPEDSFEAELWRGQQEILRRFDQQDEERRQAEAATTQNNRLLAAATTAGQNIAQRYGLQPEEVTRLATTVGPAGNGMAGALVARAGYDPVQSFEQALDYAYWTDPDLRQRAVGAAPPPLVPPAPPVTGPTPEREATKRTLHALSSGATPVAGPPPERVALETRADGRFTPESRGMLVDQLAGQLRSSGYK